MLFVCVCVCFLCVRNFNNYLIIHKICVDVVPLEIATKQQV
jgi:hypothetical protein